MKDWVKFGLAATVGYFVGFYEMKYRIVKFIAESQLEKANEESENKEA